MAKHRGGKFYEFLCLLGRVPVRIDEIAEDLEQDKQNVHPHIRRAEQAGVAFIKRRANGGLYSIEVHGDSWETVERCLKCLKKRGL